MSHESERERRFSEQEINAILGRAAEIQKQRGPTATSGGGRGLSLAELKQIAADVGIDPEYIVEAATTLGTKPASQRSLLLGASPKFQAERTIDGEIPETELPDLVDIIRRTTETQGDVNKVLDSLEWKSGHKDGLQTHVTVTQRRGQTKIQILANYWLIPYVLFMAGGFMPSMIFLAAAAENQVPMAIRIAGVAVIGLVLRTVWMWIARRREQKLHTLLDLLVNRITEAIPSAPQASSAPEPPALSDEPTPESVSLRSQKTKTLG